MPIDSSDLDGSAQALRGNDRRVCTPTYQQISGPKSSATQSLRGRRAGRHVGRPPTHPREQGAPVVEPVVLGDDEGREEDAPRDHDDAARGVDAVKVHFRLVRRLDASRHQLHAGEGLLKKKQTRARTYTGRFGSVSGMYVVNRPSERKCSPFRVDRR